VRESFTKGGRGRGHPPGRFLAWPTAGRERVVICVEARAGEDLGQTVEQYARAAPAKRESGEGTKAPERPAGVVG
jgi:hypothetical protein